MQAPPPQGWYPGEPPAYAPGAPPAYAPAAPTYAPYAMPMRTSQPNVQGGIAVLVIGIVLIMVGFPLNFALRGGAIGFVFLGFILLFVGVVVLSSAGMGGRTLPPPPPIQQPMIPVGAAGVATALNCPNCGGPPGEIDRFGIATCPHCQTRFLVR